ncbi:aspartyl/glutamyl-tRNA(Asn/Gln) amidotransferase subunit B [Nitrosomonas eutropha]|uniref:Asp-tRNA(Asn)/Glu-tRNA(Gln) amidotransferase subunit GatB n=1 Tax=Nitrosomonas TaxID=914 RepID=UPI000886E913|nr:MULTISPECIES: Asp-tRNA(Asn)/Glu-tRNA(Gln) amidotransferase subunit GatB [Nitrosomonas]MXS80338.1 Asp-tRNA(Asn)/Glu-tRNA(Gln) amidotransferase subunit GatB [Nitrosomonas sp. GH22]SCW99733.1 aspartyl/glutamyl-tRNA(Asn/Gln) amidotransferase subunit B [Nitrosomonas eutropha]SDW30081.1 aspartyl/glutamyl-tRNA(Asn/Gln) amidotransferase subunit B [Nitrosomonas eutropha]
MQWETVIGLEIHVQLLTRSKIFSGASVAYGARPNSQACAVDIALPGVLPVLNQQVVEYAIRFGLAINATINSPSIFARKNYFYPDLPKGYQISQLAHPIVEGGHVTIRTGDKEKTIHLTRAHLEEDAGKSTHEGFHDKTGIDLNRAGTGLLEIVSEPEMRSSAEAVAYARVLHSLVRWIGICDGNMQEGSFRCDANVSVRPAGSDVLGTRCEIKNLNSFRFLERAIDYEVARQIDILESGGSIVQQTRLYDADRDETRTMRSKEDAHDYRYFPDPDLLPVVIPQEWIKQIREKLPELPEDRHNRYIRDFSLSAYDANILTAARELADYFEQTVKFLPEQIKLCANWIIGEVSGRLNKEGLEIDQCPVSPEQLAGLLLRITDGTVSGKIAKDVFDSMWQSNDNSADTIIDAKNLRQISDNSEIEKWVNEVLAANQQQVADYRAGKEKAFNSLVGQVMKMSRGKANPVQVNTLLKKHLIE